MYALPLLHKLISRNCSEIHATRLNSCLLAVQALTQGAKASVTSLGRGLNGPTYDKHKIKRMDRLVSNLHLYQERQSIYQSLARRMLQGLSEPIVLIDWSPLCADQSWQLLRAALPVGGRSLTLYEEVYPVSKLGNRKVQHQFLDRLASLIPSDCRPIVVADSGFRTPFFCYVENTLKWHWLGRIRGRDFLSWADEDDHWFSAKSLYSKATTIAKRLGAVHWVRSNTLAGSIVLVRQSKRRRKDLTYTGKVRQSKRSQVHAKREREPWLLVSSQSLGQRTAKKLVKIYRSRMQIEESFRDSKAAQYGLGLSQNRRMSEKRRAVLCLLVTLANFMLWCVGMAGKYTAKAKQVRVNSSSKREPYSVIFLARLLITQEHFRLPNKAIEESLNNIKPYMESILCR